MKRYFASIAVVSLAAVAVVVGPALAQITTNPTGSVSKDTTTQSPSASPSMGDDKVKQDDKDRDQIKRQEQIDKKTGLDRADEAAGSHGAQGRDNARTRGNRQ